MISYLKLNSGDEIVADVDVTSDYYSSTLTLRYPLRIDRESLDVGEYVGFSTIIPMQLNETMKISTTSVMIREEVKSEFMKTLYNKNIEVISEKIQVNNLIFAQEMQAEKSVLN